VQSAPRSQSATATTVVGLEAARSPQSATQTALEVIRTAAQCCACSTTAVVAELEARAAADTTAQAARLLPASRTGSATAVRAELEEAGSPKPPEETTMAVLQAETPRA
jgi:hypothetical protein